MELEERESEGEKKRAFTKIMGTSRLALALRNAASRSINDKSLQKFSEEEGIWSTPSTSGIWSLSWEVWARRGPKVEDDFQLGQNSRTGDWGSTKTGRLPEFLLSDFT